jgi:hypothetical protein
VVWNLIGVVFGVWLMVRGFYYLVSLYPVAPKPSPDARVITQRGTLVSLRNAYVSDTISLQDFEVEVGRLLASGGG